MGWEDILKRRSRRIDVKRKKTGSVNTGWSKPKIKTDNDVKVEYIDKMIGVVESVSHTDSDEGTRYQQPKYDMYNVYFNMDKLGGKMVKEWVLNWLNTLKNAFKQNKTVSTGPESLYNLGHRRYSKTTSDVVVTLEKLKEIVHEIIAFTNPPHYYYGELESLEYLTIHIDGKHTTVDFDTRRLMGEQLARKEKSVSNVIRLAQDNINMFDEWVIDLIKDAIKDLEDKNDENSFAFLMHHLSKKGLLSD